MTRAGITITVDGRPLRVAPGTTVAAALLRDGITSFRRSRTGEPRAPLCGMGTCFECRATIDGMFHERTCRLPCRDGMDVSTETHPKPAFLPQSFPSPPQRREVEQVPDQEQRKNAGFGCVSVDVLVVGAGPAGLAAAEAASGCGARVAVVDDNPRAGGQIWRAHRDATAPEVEPRVAALVASGVEVHTGATIFANRGPRTLFAETPDGVLELEGRSVVIAAGAHERLLPFPGWTLPGVFGAGGLQALVKSGFDVAGRTAAVVGSGPLLLAVAAHLRDQGARVACLAEQAARRAVLGFGARLVRHPRKLTQALALLRRLRGVERLYDAWPVEARGESRLEELTLRCGNKTRTLAVDMVAAGFGLVPDTRLGALLGCGLGAGGIRVDAWQETTVPGVFAAGECTGIGGLDLASAEGRVAGLAAAGDRERDPGARRKRDRENRFARSLERAFRLRKELRELPAQDTIVCRCEDVTWVSVKDRAGPRDAKLMTRCGMGPCQGRVCGPALDFLLGWPP